MDTGIQKRLKTAIIGCGNIAGGYDEHNCGVGTWTHAKAYQEHGGFELVAAHDPEPNRLRHFCERWGVAFAAKDFHDLLDRFQPEVLSICSPNDTHFAFLKEALACRSVKGILCEKPLTLSSHEAREVETLAKGKVLLVNYQRRWDTLLSEVGTALRAGQYGQVTAGRVFYTKGVFHNASHAINLLLGWLGPVKDVNVNEVIARNGADFVADFSLSFERGPRIFFQGLDARNFNTFEIELFTTRARLRLPGGSSLELQIREPSPLAAGEHSLGPSQATASTLAGALPKVVSNLFDTIASRSELVMPLSEAVETVFICEQIREFAEGRKPHG